MLVGRESERQVLDALVTSARVGRSGTLVLIGEAGIGKSTLLEDAAGRAREARMPVLWATGVAAEREVPFGGLLQLLRPVLSFLPSIPAPQAAALGSALALTPGSGAQRFAVGAATLSLLSRAAEDAPMLCVVDDAHHLDVPSSQALCFAARRLSADPLCLLFAVRADIPCVVGDAELPSLPVGGLTDAEAAALVRAEVGAVSDAAATRLHSVTGGNPLAVLELAQDLDALLALPEGVPVPVPQSVADAFAQRAQGLSAGARTAVLVAASGVDDLGVVTRACAHLGVNVSALDEARSARLLAVDLGRVVFRHGLVPSGVYARATPAERRAVHEAVAAALPAEDDRRAWHLGEAAVGPDARVAAELARAAERASLRGAYAVAAAGFRRAASLATRPADEAEHLVAAAESAWRAGGADVALELLARARLRPVPEALEVRVAVLDATIAVRAGDPVRAYDALVATGAQIAAGHPDRAVELLGEAVVAAQFVGDATAMSRAAAAIEALRPRLSARSAWIALVATGIAGVAAGTGGADRLHEALARTREDPGLLADPPLAPWVVLGTLFLRESGGREQVAAVMGHVRSRTDLAVLPVLLFYVGRDQATTDRWDDATASYTEGVQLAREAGQATDLAACLAGLAWLEARRGAEAECLAHAEEALASARERQLGFFEVWSVTALAELDLGLGRAEAALTRFQEVDRLLAASGFDDVDISPGPELVEALLRVGSGDEARSQARRYADRARAKGQPWSLARAARGLGLVAPDDAVDEHFQVALEHHARTLDGFETARTELAYGARLRRSRRRVDARPVLRSALGTFDALGARVWADRAETELKATGESAQRRGVSGVEQLTPQERQVARILAGGATTREAAAALFLSPKTVEYHLRHVYLKLGIRSRAELADAMPETA
ncbi:LuxR family transcriptional regulator [uncultured Phycicoccus sp.]|uniref:LuxR family transcriptional regulator n=1 Tax=uncultured Phycicoccus sp. TaxID=661422 RepID=UPI00261478FD|nr:LuxR family transcriptional regulator [uncultured Phycicoccus sp.]